ncbi:hypothetical protein BH09ACT4_BH09ACT4_14300 [soil metagenome]
MAMKILVGKLTQLVFGGIIGAVLDGIITGDENYAVILGVGLPILLTVVGVVASLVGSRRKKKALLSTSPQPPGIISTMPEVAKAAQQEAVLNPVSTAQPSAGAGLNGELVGGPADGPGDGSGDGPGTPAKPARIGGAPLGWRALAILTIAVGAAAALIPSYGTIGWIASDVAAGRPFDGRDMRTGLHQQEAFDQIAGVIGGTQVTSISFYDSYIEVDAPTSPGSRTVDLFVWKYGYAHREGPGYTQPDVLGNELFDASDIDMSIVAKVVRASIADAKLDNVGGVYPMIARDFDGGEPQISISMSNDYFSAYYTYTVTGELIQKSGSAFE